MKTAAILVAAALVVVVHGNTVTIPELGSVLGSTIKSAWSNRTIYKYLSVKYGMSPSGDRRFAPPVAVEPWEGTYNSTVQGIRCPQIYMLDDLINNPTNNDMEDCLSMNIFSPISEENTTISELLPVMVYFHGGGFYEGESKFFTPEYLLEQDVLLVVPQYRLGPLGFLCLHTDNIAGNMAFMDQILALQWINKYIKYFGGDNSRVTIFGQSAGAASVSALLLSPIVQPYLFQKAIVQSGSAFGSWMIHKDPLAYGKDLYHTLTNSTEDVNVDVMEETFKNSPLIEFLLAILQQIKMDPTILNTIGRAVVQKAGAVKFLTESPLEIIKKGNHRTVPMMAGITKHDGSFLLTSVYDGLEAFGLQDNDDFLRNNITGLSLRTAEIFDGTDMLIDTLNNKYFKKVFDEDRSITFRDLGPGLTDIYGLLMFKSQTLKLAKMNAKYSNETFFYTLDYRGEHTRFGYGEDTSKYPFDGGVHHSDDLLYLFPYPYTTPLNDDDTKIAKIMSQLWSNFAIDGAPSSSVLGMTWPPLRKGKNGPFLHINGESSIGDDFVDSEYTAAIDEIK